MAMMMMMIEKTNGQMMLDSPHPSLTGVHTHPSSAHLLTAAYPTRMYPPNIL